MSRSLQGSSACKLPFKCCDFVVSQFNYLFTNLWNNQKPPPTCYTTSVVGLLTLMVVLLLGISQRKILPQKQLGPCIKYLALLLHCSLAGAHFIFLRNPLLLHLWTPDLLLLCLPLPLLLTHRFRVAIRTSRPTTALLGTASLLRILRLPRLLLVVAAHQLGLPWPHFLLHYERAVPFPCESHPLHMLRLIVVLGHIHHVLPAYDISLCAHYYALSHAWLYTPPVLCSTFLTLALVHISMSLVAFLYVLPLSLPPGGSVTTSGSLDGLRSTFWTYLSGLGTTILTALSGITLWMFLSGLGSTIWTAL